MVSLDTRTVWRRLQKPFYRRSRPGAVPGTVMVDPDDPKPVIRLIGFGKEGFCEQRLDAVEQLPELLDQMDIAWVNVDGLGDAHTIRQLGEIFQLHPLALEDVVNVHQRAKVEDYGKVLFVVARMVTAKARLETEQISIFVGEKFVLSFQETEGDCLNSVRDRLRQGIGRVRFSGTDYLLYALLDAIIDGYFPVIERYGEELDQLDEIVSDHGGPSCIARLHEVRSDLLQLRRAIWPHRDAISVLLRGGHGMIGHETNVYLRDCHDHTVQIIDVLELYRETCSDLREYYFTTLGNRTNEIMRVLTIIATIFMPISFIAGVYGMNFDTIPELHWAFGYPFVVGMMALVAGIQLLFFWRRGWLRAYDGEPARRDSRDSRGPS
jgi:magnesium transporter